MWSFDTDCKAGSSACPTKHINRDCRNSKFDSVPSSYAHRSWKEAKDACTKLGASCWGLYDANCAKQTADGGKDIYLCDSSKIKSAANLSYSGLACSFEKPTGA